MPMSVLFNVNLLYLKVRLSVFISLGFACLCANITSNSDYYYYVYASGRYVVSPNTYMKHVVGMTHISLNRTYLYGGFLIWNHYWQPHCDDTVPSCCSRNSYSTYCGQPQLFLFFSCSWLISINNPVRRMDGRLSLHWDGSGKQQCFSAICPFINTTDISAATFFFSVFFTGVRKSHGTTETPRD